MLLFLQLHYSGEKITLLLVTVDGTKTHIHALKKKKLTAIAENRSDNVHVRLKAAQLQLVEGGESATLSGVMNG